MTITKELLEYMVANDVAFQNSDTLDKEATYELIFRHLYEKSTKNDDVCEKSRKYGKHEIDSLFRNTSEFHEKNGRWLAINVTYCCSCCDKEIVVEVPKSRILKFDCNRHLKISNEYFGKDRLRGRYHFFVDQYLMHDKNKPICQNCYDKNISLVREEVEKIGLNAWEYLNGTIKSFIKIDNCYSRLFENVKRDKETGKILQYTCNITGETYIERKYQEKLDREEEIRRKELEEKNKKEKAICEKNTSLRKRDDINEATKLYIKKFCTPCNEINVKDEKIQEAALSPSAKVDLEFVKTHNSCILEYKKYLQTPLWKIIAYKVKKRDGFKCRKCGSKNYIDVHHTSYDHLGIDFVAMDKLVTLCRGCHEHRHNDANVEQVSKLIANDSHLLYDIRDRLDEEIQRMEKQHDIYGGQKLRDIKKEVVILIDKYL